METNIIVIKINLVFKFVNKQFMDTNVHGRLRAGPRHLGANLGVQL